MPFLPPIYHKTAKVAAETSRVADVERLQCILRKHLREQQQQQKTGDGADSPRQGNQQQQQLASSARTPSSSSSNQRKTSKRNNNAIANTTEEDEQQRRVSSARGLPRIDSNRGGRHQQRNDATQNGAAARRDTSDDGRETRNGPRDAPRTRQPSTTSASATNKNELNKAPEGEVEGAADQSGDECRSGGSRDPSVENISPRPTSAEQQQEQEGGGTEQQTTTSPTSASSSYKAVAFVDDGDNVGCPECGQLFSIHEHMKYRQHVFDCRLVHGKEPLMPLHVARKSHATVPRDAFATVVRPIQSTLMTVDVFAGVPMAAKRSNRDVSESIAAAVRKWTKTLAASSGQLFTLQRPIYSAEEEEGDGVADAEGGEEAGDDEGDDAKKLITAGPESKNASKKSNTSAAASIGHKKSMRGKKGGARRANPGTSERMESDVNDALREAILEASIVPADGSKMGHCTLNLTGHLSSSSSSSSPPPPPSSPTNGNNHSTAAHSLSIPYRQSVRLASVLHPLDGSVPLPVRVIDLSNKARFVGEESAQVFFAAVMKSSTVEKILTEKEGDVDKDDADKEKAEEEDHDEESEDEETDEDDSDSDSTHETKKSQKKAATAKREAKKEEKTDAKKKDFYDPSTSNNQGLLKHLSKTRFTLAAVLEHLAANASARAEEDEDRAFLQHVNAYHLRAEDFQNAANTIANKVRSFIARLQQEEQDERRAIFRLMADDKAEHDRRLARQALKKQRAAARQAVCDEEAEVRCRIEEAAFEATTQLILNLEKVQRVSTVERDQADARQRIKYLERENVFRCVVIRDARKAFNESQRLFLEERAAVEKGDILTRFIQDMLVFKVQQDQHKLIAIWRKRQREELEAVIRTEDRLRETIKKDEDMQFITAKERLSKAIESINIKDRAQRAYVEDYERLRRREFEGAVNVFFETNYYFFMGKSRVLKTLAKIKDLERERLRLITEVPKVHIEGFKAKHGILIFATPTPGHDLTDPISVFGTAGALKASCGMGSEWVQSLQNIERQCKKSVEDERSAMVEYLGIIQRNFRVRADAGAIALNAINADEPPMRDVLLISKPAVVPITLRQAGNSNATRNAMLRNKQNSNALNNNNFATTATTVSFDDTQSAASGGGDDLSHNPLARTNSTFSMARSASNLQAMKTANQFRSNSKQSTNNNTAANGIFRSSSGSMTLKAPLTAQDLYSAEEDIAAAQQEVLALRTAWADKATAGEIRKAKERIVSAKITLMLSNNKEDVEAAKKIPCEHNLLTSIALREDLLVSIVCDGDNDSSAAGAASGGRKKGGGREVLPQPPATFFEEQPANDDDDEESEVEIDENVNDLLLTQTGAGGFDVDTMNSAKEEGEEADQRPRPTPLNNLSYATRKLEITLEPLTAENEQRFIQQRNAVFAAALGPSLNASNPTPPHRRSLMGQSTRSNGSITSLGGNGPLGQQQRADGGGGARGEENDQPFAPSAPFPKTGIELSAVVEALSTVLYRCTVDPSLYGSHDAVATHLTYSVDFVVEMCDAYVIEGSNANPSAADLANVSPSTSASPAASVSLVPHPPSSSSKANSNANASPLSSSLTPFALPTIGDLYSPRQPSTETRRVTLTHNGRLEVAVIPTLFTVAPPKPTTDAAVVDAGADGGGGAIDASALAPKVIVEGQIDAIPVVRALGGLSDQWVTVLHPRDADGKPLDKLAEVRRRDDPRNGNAEEVEIVGGLCGGSITFEVLGEGVSNFDRISLAEEFGAVRFDAITQNRAKSIERVFIHERLFGTIAEGGGVAQVTQSLVPSTAAPNHPPRFVINIDPQYPAQLVDESARRLLQQLRYHNYQEGPAEGVRNIRITVETVDGARSAFDTKFEVEEIDKPTELKLPFDKVIHRIPCLTVPPFMRPAVTEVLVPIFPQAVVFDEDTDRFSGGFIKVTMNNGGKGDAIGFCPNSHLWNFVDEAFGITPLVSVAEGSTEIVFEGRIVAKLVEGQILRSRQWAATAAGGRGSGAGTDGDAAPPPPPPASTVTECTFVHIAFTSDDSCSIAAVQACVRCVVFLNSNPPYNSKGHPMGAKDFAIDCQIMDNEQATRINKFVTVRGGPHTVQLLEKGATLDYKENNPPVKLGYFDLNKDSINPVNNFGGGYILVSLVEGYDNDVIQLKAEDGEYQLIEPRKPKGIRTAVNAMRVVGGGHLQSQASFAVSSPTFGTLRSTASFAPSPSGLQTNRSMMVSSPNGGGSDKSAAAVSSSVNSAAEKLLNIHTSNIIKNASAEKYDAFSGNSNTSGPNGTAVPMKPLAINFSGMALAMATYLPFKGGLLIQFAPDTKRDQIQRRHVMTLLRNITYFHNGLDVKSTQKIARVLVSDSTGNTPTQSLVQINLEVADDITEIRCKSPRRRIVQSIENNYPLLPYGRSLVHDNDTEYFDGGSLHVQCIAGSSKGDGFTIVPPHLQSSAVRLQRTMPPIPDLTVPMDTSIVYNDFMKTFIDGEGRELAKVETSIRDGGVAEVKFLFPKHAENSPDIVTRNLVSYMMNSLLFGNQADRLRDNSRTFMIRIKDPSNPAEGKLKLSLEVNPPHISFQTSSSVAATSNTTAFESSVVSRMLMPSQSGAGVNPGARILVNLDRLTELKPIAGPPQIAINVSGPSQQLNKVRLFVPVSERDCGLTLKEGRNIMAAGGLLVATLDHVDQHNAVIAFQTLPAAKSSALTRDKLQNLLRNVIVSNSEELATKGGLRAQQQQPSPNVNGEMEGFGDIAQAFESAGVNVTVVEDGAESQSGDTSPEANAGASNSNKANAPRNPRPPAAPPSLNGADERESIVGSISMPRTRPTGGSLRGASQIFGANRRQSLFSGSAKSGATNDKEEKDKGPAFVVPTAEDDDEIYTLVVTWAFHDGMNETVIKTRLCPKKQQPIPAGTSVASPAGATASNLPMPPSFSIPLTSRRESKEATDASQ